MNAQRDPQRDSITSEFESDTAAANYDQWFRAKVQQSLVLANDPRTPRYSSDEVMRRIHDLFKLETKPVPKVWTPKTKGAELFTQQVQS